MNPQCLDCRGSGP